MTADGVPTDKLDGESLVTCQKIGSTATSVGEAKDDPKVRPCPLSMLRLSLWWPSDYGAGFVVACRPFLSGGVFL